MTVQPTELAREAGDGSRSETEEKKNAGLWKHKDQRAETETTFFESDINNLQVSERRKRQLRRSLRRQEGETPGESFHDDTSSRGQQNHREWRRRIASVYCSKFGLTPHQKRRVQHLVGDVLDVNSFGPHSTEQVVLATINVVAREDQRWIEDEEEFVEAVASENTDRTELRRLRKMVKSRL